MKGFLLRILSVFVSLNMFITTAFAALPVYSVSIPTQNGHISQRWYNFNDTINNDKLVILVQDAHTSLEAQKNLALIINNLVSKFKKSQNDFFVGIEGASCEYDLKELRHLPDKKIKTKIALNFVKDGKFIGAELASIIADNDFSLLGLEDKKLLHKSLLLFRSLLRKQNNIVEPLKNIENDLNKITIQTFNKDLLAFSQKSTEYQKETDKNKDFISFITYLYQTAEQLNIDITDYTYLFYLLEQLQKQNKLNNLLDFNGLLLEINDLIYDIKSQLAQNQNEKKIIFIEKQLSLLKKIISAKASKSEVKRFKRTAENISLNDIYLQLKSLNGFPYKKYKSFFITADKYLDKAVEFYNLADQRDVAMLNKLIAAMNQRQQKTAILISGGYHTENLADNLKKQKIPFITITPNITHISDDTSYYNRMAGQTAQFNNFKFEELLNQKITASFIELNAEAYNNFLTEAKLQIIDGLLLDENGNFLTYEELKTKVKQYKRQKKQDSFTVADSLLIVYEALTEAEQNGNQNILNEAIKIIHNNYAYLKNTEQGNFQKHQEFAPSILVDNVNEYLSFLQETLNNLLRLSQSGSKTMKIKPSRIARPIKWPQINEQAYENDIYRKVDEVFELLKKHWQMSLQEHAERKKYGNSSIVLPLLTTTSSLIMDIMANTQYADLEQPKDPKYWARALKGFMQSNCILSLDQINTNYRKVLALIEENDSNYEKKIQPYLLNNVIYNDLIQNTINRINNFSIRNYKGLNILSKVYTAFSVYLHIFYKNHGKVIQFNTNGNIYLLRNDEKDNQIIKNNKALNNMQQFIGRTKNKALLVRIFDKKIRPRLEKLKNTYSYPVDIEKYKEQLIHNVMKEVKINIVKGMSSLGEGYVVSHMENNTLWLGELMLNTLAANNNTEFMAEIMMEEALHNFTQLTHHAFFMQYPSGFHNLDKAVPHSRKFIDEICTLAEKIDKKNNLTYKTKNNLQAIRKNWLIGEPQWQSRDEMLLATIEDIRQSKEIADKYGRIIEEPEKLEEEKINILFALLIDSRNDRFFTVNTTYEYLIARTKRKLQELLNTPLLNIDLINDTINTINEIAREIEFYITIKNPDKIKDINGIRKSSLDIGDIDDIILFTSYIDQGKVLRIIKEDNGEISIYRPQRLDPPIKLQDKEIDRLNLRKILNVFQEVFFADDRTILKYIDDLFLAKMKEIGASSQQIEEFRIRVLNAFRQVENFDMVEGEAALINKDCSACIRVKGSKHRSKGIWGGKRLIEAIVNNTEVHKTTGQEPSETIIKLMLDEALHLIPNSAYLGTHITWHTYNDTWKGVEHTTNIENSIIKIIISLLDPDELKLFKEKDTFIKSKRAGIRIMIPEAIRYNNMMNNIQRYSNENKTVFFIAPDLPAYLKETLLNTIDDFPIKNKIIFDNYAAYEKYQEEHSLIYLGLNKNNINTAINNKQKKVVLLLGNGKEDIDISTAFLTPEILLGFMLEKLNDREYGFIQMDDFRKYFSSLKNVLNETILKDIYRKLEDAEKAKTIETAA